MTTTVQKRRARLQTVDDLLEKSMDLTDALVRSASVVGRIGLSWPCGRHLLGVQTVNALSDFGSSKRAGFSGGVALFGLTRRPSGGDCQ